MGLIVDRKVPVRQAVAVPAVATLLLGLVAVAGLATPATASACDPQQAVMPNPDMLGGDPGQWLDSQLPQGELTVERLISEAQGCGAVGQALEDPKPKPVLVCPGGVYYKVFDIVQTQDASYFAFYANALGGIAIDYKIASGQVATSNAATGFHLNGGDGGPHDEEPPIIDFASTTLGYAGTCGVELGTMAIDVWYSGKVQGVVEQVKQVLAVNCQIVTSTKMHFGWFTLGIAGYGEIGWKESATVVCAENSSAETVPDIIFDTPVSTLLLPNGGGAMVCWGDEVESAAGQTCVLSEPFPI